MMLRNGNTFTKFGFSAATICGITIRWRYSMRTQKLTFADTQFDLPAGKVGIVRVGENMKPSFELKDDSPAVIAQVKKELGADVVEAETKDALPTQPLPNDGQPRMLNMKNYTQAVKSGFKKIPEAMQVERLFGEADHFISNSGPKLPQYWTTQVFLYRRYELMMQVEVRTNSTFSEVTEVVREPEFFGRNRPPAFA